MRFLCFAGALAQHNRICKQGRSEPKDSVKLLLQPRKPMVAATVKKQNRAAHDGLPGLLLSCIINLHKNQQKTDCPSRTVCRTQKSRFLHESASLEPETANVWHPPDALFRKQKEGCKHDLICSSTMINPACISWLTLLRQQCRMVRWGAMQSRREISTHIAERVFQIHAAHPNSACTSAQKLRL